MKTSEICKECSQQSDCCFIDNGLQHRCGVVSAYKRGFEDGIGQIWHPASELPPIDKNGNSVELIAITHDNNLMKVYFHYESEKYNFWVESDDWNKQVQYGVNVKWWCNLPKED